MIGDRHRNSNRSVPTLRTRDLKKDVPPDHDVMDRSRLRQARVGQHLSEGGFLVRHIWEPKMPKISTTTGRNNEARASTPADVLTSPTWTWCYRRSGKKHTVGSSSKADDRGGSDDGTYSPIWTNHRIDGIGITTFEALGRVCTPCCSFPTPGKPSFETTTKPCGINPCLFLWF
jgi:hypothetical protein